MHGELVADDHRQQARAGAPARDGMVRRRRLGDGLAGPAAELLPHRLHHLPLPGHHLQRLRDVFPQLDQIAATTAGAGLGRGQHDPLARQVGRQRRPLGLAAGEGAHRGIAVVGFALARVLARRCLHLLQLQFQLIQQVAAPFRGLAVPLSTQLRDQQLQMFDLGFRPCPARSSASAARSSASAARSSANAARKAAISAAGLGAEDIMGGSEPEPAPARQPCSST